MGIEAALKVGGKILTGSKAYIKPVCKIGTSKTAGLKMKSLTGDVVQISKKTRSPETYQEMIQHFSIKHPNRKLAENIAIKGVEAHPENLGLIEAKNLFTDDSATYLKDISRAIELKPTAQGYLLRYGELIENGKTKEALADLKKALEYAKKEKLDPDFISEIESTLGTSAVTDSNVARKLTPLPVTKEQAAFNTKVNDYWNKYQKEIDEAFNEKLYFSKSNANTALVETSAKEHLLKSIKETGYAEKFGLKPNQIFFHGTTPEAYTAITNHGFDLNKCGRIESGKGVYLGFDEHAVRNAYGSNVVVARFTGKNIAKVEPGVYETVSGSGGMTPFKLGLASKMGLDICKKEDCKLLDEIISKYYNKILENKGIEGIVTDVSFNAGMPYFMVPNPSKYLEIL